MGRLSFSIADPDDTSQEKENHDKVNQIHLIHSNGLIEPPTVSGITLHYYLITICPFLSKKTPAVQGTGPPRTDKKGKIAFFS